MTDGVVIIASVYTLGIRCLEDSLRCIIPFVRLTNANNILCGDVMKLYLHCLCRRDLFGA